MRTQALELTKRPHVIVATPGRLADHLRSSSDVVKLDRLQFLVCMLIQSVKLIDFFAQVLDEIDQLLDESFAEDLESVLDAVPKQRQTLLFTATMTPEIESLRFQAKTEPFIHACASKYSTVDQLDQKYMLVPSVVRDAYLTYLLREEFQDKTVIVFMGKCRTCEQIRVMLGELGIQSAAMHSQMSQRTRIASLARFKSGIVKVLVATDVGSRCVLFDS